MVNAENNKIEELSKKFQLNQFVTKLLITRGYNTEEKISRFLQPGDADFYDPFLLKGMREAVERINKAIDNKEKVLIFGDYDVDGVSATAILMKYFSSRNFYVDYYLPNRYIDGYGLTCEVLDKIKSTYAPDLIITVDCGISCEKEVCYAGTLGIDIIVTDHHEIPEVCPKTIVIDAKQKGQKYPFKELCGAGVAFKVVQALSGLAEAKKYLGICAIATIADIVPLVDENRAIVSLGMKDFEKNLPLGIKMLFKDCKLSLNASSTDIAFRLTPKINAAGRMGDASVALKLYLKEDRRVLGQIAEQIGLMNTERQALGNKIYDDVVAKLNQINIADFKAIALYDKNWDLGILGIVSARIAEEYNKPTVLFNEDGQFLRGSARSIGDIDIYSVISGIKESVEIFGGHKMAAGLTVKKSNFAAFVQSLNSSLKGQYKAADYIPQDSYDFVIKPGVINEAFIKDLEALEPCGCGNHKPTFSLKFNKVTVSSVANYPSHININSENLSIIAFNSSKYIPLLKNTDEQDVVVELQNNEYKGKKYIKAIAQNITTKEIKKPGTNDFVFGEYIKQLFKRGSKPHKFFEYDKKLLHEIIDASNVELFGTLFVANTYETYNQFITNLNRNYEHLKHYLYTIIGKEGINSVVLAPTNMENFNQFNKIIFLDPVLDKDYIFAVAERTNAKVFAPDYKKVNTNIFKGLSADRNVFVEYFKMLQDLASKMRSYDNELVLFKQLKLINPQNKKLNYKQFIYCLYTFIELGIFDLKKEGDFLTLAENKKVFTSLGNSQFYNDINLILQTI